MHSGANFVLAKDQLTVAEKELFQTQEKDIRFVLSLEAEKGLWSFKVADLMTGMVSNFASSGKFLLPRNERVELRISAIDGEYPLYIPELDIDSLAIPGRLETLYLQPSKVNQFRSQCTDECKPEWEDFLIDVLIIEKQDFISELNNAEK